jgi:hypothetical protein
VVTNLDEERRNWVLGLEHSVDVALEVLVQKLKDQIELVVVVNDIEKAIKYQNGCFGVRKSQYGGQEKWSGDAKQIPTRAGRKNLRT